MFVNCCLWSSAWAGSDNPSAASAGDEAPAPSGYWNALESDAILDRTLRIHLAPSLDHLSDAEHGAVRHLLRAGRVLHDLYLLQKHHQALSSRARLWQLAADGSKSVPTAALLELYWLGKGPVITTLDNQREPFLPVDHERPGRNVYPLDAGRAQIDAYLAEHAGQRSDILAERTVVRRTSEALLAHYRGILDDFPALTVLHDRFVDDLHRASADPADMSFLAVPYAVEYAAQLQAVTVDLNAAARLLGAGDPDLSAYLRNRARDLLSNDYESGDASWVTGRFKNLNAQIGSYETYDDKLYGVKSFFSLGLLVRDDEKSRQLGGAVETIQVIEDSLPYATHKRVRTNIPVGVYNVVADFGQSRGSNTATILPNDANHSRKYGRTILLRYNIMTNPEIFANTHRRFAAATESAIHADLTSEARFNRTLFHEIGHYLGVERSDDGRSLDIAIGQYSDLLEEMKSDLVSLFAIPILTKSGYYSDDMARAVRAAGLSRTLQVVEPRRHQPYQTMQLMQFNYFLENEVIKVGGEKRLLSIDHNRYQDAVVALLRQVLALQAAGDARRVEDFVERWGYWREEPHARLGGLMRDAISHRYTLVTYDVEKNRAPVE